MIEGAHAGDELGLDAPHHGGKPAEEVRARHQVRQKIDAACLCRGGILRGFVHEGLVSERLKVLPERAVLLDHLFLCNRQLKTEHKVSQGMPVHNVVTI